MYANALIQTFIRGLVELAGEQEARLWWGWGCRKGLGSFVEGKYLMHEKAFPYINLLIKEWMDNYN